MSIDPILTILILLISFRLPGVVLDIRVHDNKSFYKIGVVGGILNTSYLRQDLVHEIKQTPEFFGLEGIREGNWRDLPQISVRQGLKQVSITGGQGYVKCQCKGTCATAKCACFKAERKCNSRCHKSNATCCNHDD